MDAADFRNGFVLHAAVKDRPDMRPLKNHIRYHLYANTKSYVCTVWCGSVVCGVVWGGVVWCGVVWYRIVSYRMVWYGMVWYAS